MKEMFSSFFKTIGRILAYIFIGIILALVFKGCDVFAATDSGYSSYTHTAWYYRYIDDTVEGTCSSNYFNVSDDTTATDVVSDNTYFSLNDNTTYLNGQIKTDYIGKIRLRVFAGSSYTWNKENLYTFRFTFNFKNTDEDFLSKLKKYYTINAVYGNTSSSDSGKTTDYISSFSWYWEKGSVDGRYLLYLNVQPSSNIKYIHFYITAENQSKAYISQSVFGSYNMSYIKVTYEEGVSAAIKEQTSIIQNKMNEFMNIFQKNNDEIKDIYTNDTENEDGTCNGVICNLKKVVKSVLDFPKIIFNAVKEVLLSLFVPSSDFLIDWINGLIDTLNEQFGLLSYPLTLTIDVINRFYNIPISEPIIEIPAIKDPFFNQTIYKGTTINLNDYLVGAVGTLYHIGYIFVNAYICIAFVELCRSKYNNFINKRDDNVGYDVTIYENEDTTSRTNFDSEGNGINQKWSNIDRRIEKRRK